MAAPLSPAQFKGFTPTEHEGTLPLGNETNTTSAMTAAWRKPRRALPLSSATLGSVFKPSY